MPQKTRKAKIAASKRRQLRLIMDGINPTGPQTETEKVQSVLHVRNQKSSLHDYLITDLRKSLILIVVVFALEFLLYFARIGNHIR